MNKRFFLAICIFCFSLGSSPLFASKSKPFRSQEEADAYLTTHYNLGCKYYNQKSWRRASTEFEKVIYFFPESDAAAEASYYLAVSYFEMKEYDFANEEFSNYLKAAQHPEFFEDAVYFKFCIAEHFKAGKKKRPFKMRYLPKWVSGQDSALVIYDEVVAALPNHDLTIEALASKADLLKTMGEYRESIETYQLIIRRFPRNEIIPLCYLNIAETYYQQSRYEFQNPDILALAELNVRKFRDDFPRDERVALAEEYICKIKELYAKGLCDLGLFYERMNQPDAAAIYFKSSIEEFPDTSVARFCRSKLICLGYPVEGENLDCQQEAAECVEQMCSRLPEAENEEFLENEEFARYNDSLQQTQLEQDFLGSDQETSTENHCYGRPEVSEEYPTNRAILHTDKQNAVRNDYNESSQIENNVSFTNDGNNLQDYDQYSLKKKQANDSFYQCPVCGRQKNNHPLCVGRTSCNKCHLYQEENPPYYLHYSQLKRREQRVAPRQ